MNNKQSNNIHINNITRHLCNCCTFYRNIVWSYVFFVSRSNAPEKYVLKVMVFESLFSFYVWKLEYKYTPALGAVK